MADLRIEAKSKRVHQQLLTLRFVDRVDAEHGSHHVEARKYGKNTGRAGFRLFAAAERPC